MVERGGHSRLCGASIVNRVPLELHPTEYSQPTTFDELPIQANGAHPPARVPRYRARICAPIHDAILIEAPLKQTEADVAAIRLCDSKASRRLRARNRVPVMAAISHKSFDIRNDTWTSAVSKCGTQFRACRRASDAAGSDVRTKSCRRICY